MKYLCGKCIHIDVCYVFKSIGCVEQCEHFKEYTLQAEPQPTEDYLPINCYVCNGSGWIAGNAYRHTHKCSRCDGSGKINYKTLTHDDWRRTATTEDMAKWLAKEIRIVIMLTLGKTEYTDNITSAKWWEDWLKEKHNAESMEESNTDTARI